jgi:2'-5' RNA ligase
MRCFIAIDLPEDVKKEIFKVQTEISKISDVKMKLVEPENLHLTLKFLGEIDDAQANQIKEALNGIKFKKFEGTLNQIGIFPTPNFIRVIWIGMEPSVLIKEMHAKIDEELSKLKIKKEKQFESHITLSRVKFVKEKEALIAKLKEVKVPKLSFKVEDFVLKKSILTGQGPVYEDVTKFGLE